MPDPVESLRLLVEAAVAIAGFSGIVVVFGRRLAGDWSEGERVQLGNLLTTSLTVLLLSLAILVVLHAGISAPTTWRIGSGSWAIFCSFMLVRRFRQRRRIPQAELQRAGPTTSLFLYGVTVALTVLNLANAIELAEFWPFLAAQVWLFAVSCYAFVQLLAGGTPAA